ncbi:MAG: CubicO group peptidase (beta-lactamase class C family) [Limisphaerales bacterium]|jgi:CubicO group peptidase (beta-lactamase class C family)
MRIAKLLLVFIVGIAAWGVLTVYLALNGVWMTPVVSSGDTDVFYDWAVSEIGAKNKGSSALVLLQNGVVAKQYFSNNQDTIDENTLFATASFSKWVAALGVLSLVEDKLVDLDAPVSNYLTRWKLPESEFDNDEVTVRLLLSHTAGLTDGLGFGDYQFDEVIPPVEDELRSPRASSGENVEIAVGVEPGAEFNYSGGGYLILQLLVEEVSGVTFAEYIQQTIFDPLGMDRSTYSSVAGLDNVSSSYELDGTKATSFQYASAAATGLASSPSDLSKLVKSMLAADGVPIGEKIVVETREPHGFVMGMGVWGLGTILYAPTQKGDYVFGHDGVNDPALNSTVRMNPDTADAMVMLVSGHPTLASNIGSEWVLWQTGVPDFLQTEKALKSAIVPFLIGSFFVIFAILLWSRRRV